MQAHSFDSYLKTGGQVKIDGLTLKATNISVASIRDWHGPLGSELSDEELELLVVGRRTRLWKMVLASGMRTDDAAFTVPPDLRLDLKDGISYPRSRASSYVLRPRERAAADIPLQQVHVSPYAIPPELADVSCSNLTDDEILAHVNDIFGTSISLAHVAGSYATRGITSRWQSMDIGTLYTHLRPIWPPPPPNAEYSFSLSSRHPPCMYERFYGMSSASTADTVPRRLWDLYSNRVAEFDSLWPLRQTDDLPPNVWAVSHNWVADADREAVRTPINGREWPVPMPKATTLDHVRIELLNMGAEYVFLDVLCLRQEGETREEEWKDDIPILGNVYRDKPYQTVVTYFNGLGLPFNLLEENLRLPYHWLNRSWTLQETVANWLPGGLRADIPGLSTNGPVFMSALERALDVATKRRGRVRLYNLLHEFQRRPGYASGKPFDQVFALSYLLFPSFERDLYAETWPSVEHPWNNVVSQLTGLDLLHLLTCCPLVRQADAVAARKCELSAHSWWPTWRQVMSAPLMALPREAYAPQEYLRQAKPVTASPQSYEDELSGDLWHYHAAYVVDECRISRAGDAVSFVSRDGELSVTAPADVGLHIGDDEQFVLVGVANLECWVVGRKGPERTLADRGTGAVGVMLEVQKVTVGRASLSEDRAKPLELINERYSYVACPRLVCYAYRPGLKSVA